MSGTFTAQDLIYMKKIFILFTFSLVLFAVVGKCIGETNKAKWFKKRTKYTIFTRRSILGEFIHFGRPCSIEGAAIFVCLITSILSIGYVYLFVLV